MYTSFSLKKDLNENRITHTYANKYIFLSHIYGKELPLTFSFIAYFLRFDFVLIIIKG